MDKLKNYQATKSTFLLLKLISDKKETEARHLAFDANFKIRNRDFLSSGKPVMVALRAGLDHLANELMDNGYDLPPSGVIELISDYPEETVCSFIKLNKFSGQCIELQFWYLLYKGYKEAGNSLRLLNPQLNVYLI